MIIAAGSQDPSIIVERVPPHVLSLAPPTVLWINENDDILPTIWDVNADFTPDILTSRGYFINGSNGEEFWHKTVNNAEPLPALVAEVNDDFHFDVIFSDSATRQQINAYDGRWGIPLWTWTCSERIEGVVLANIDQIDKHEIVVSCGGSTYFLSVQTGTVMWESQIGSSMIAVADLTGDSALEIVGVLGNKIHTILSDGDLLWSKEIGINSLEANQRDMLTKPSLGDIDNDGALEIVVGCTNGYIYALDAFSGNIEWKYGPMTSLGGYDLKSPSLGDIDNDGRLEVVFTNGSIFALNGESGTLLWMYETSTSDEYTFTSATIADISGDRKLDVIVGGDNLYAIDGTTGEAFWVYSTGGSFWNPVVADLDGDEKLEIVVSSRGDLYALSVPDAGSRVYWQSYDGSEYFTRDSSQQNLDPDFDFLSTDTEAFVSHTLINNNDTDSDGCSDCWEYIYNFNPQVNENPSGFDSDSDGLNNLEEAVVWTNPYNSDSDSDLISDYQEVRVYFTDPLNQDTDYDLLSDSDEILQYGTNPLQADTDYDEMPDGWEVLNSLNPLLNDALEDFDSDGLLNIYEMLNGTNPRMPDSDLDGIGDGWEVNFGYDPLSPLVPLDELLLWFSPYIMGGTFLFLVSGYVFSFRLGRKLALVDKVVYKPNASVQIGIGILCSIGVSLILFSWIIKLLSFLTVLDLDNRYLYAIYRISFLSPSSISGTVFLTCLFAIILGSWSGIDENLIESEKLNIRQISRKVGIGVLRETSLALRYVLPIVLFIGYIVSILGIGFPIVQFRSEGLEPFFTVAFFVSTGFISIILALFSVVAVTVLLTVYVTGGYSKSIS